MKGSIIGISEKGEESTEIPVSTRGWSGPPRVHRIDQSWEGHWSFPVSPPSSWFRVETGRTHVVHCRSTPSPGPGLWTVWTWVYIPTDIVTRRDPDGYLTVRRQGRGPVSRHKPESLIPHLDPCQDPPASRRKTKVKTVGLKQYDQFSEVGWVGYYRYYNNW